MKTLFIALMMLMVSPMVLADASGRVDDIDYTNRTVVIDDTFYRLSKDLKVIGADGKKTTIFAVQNGSFVDVETSGELTAQKTITLRKILKSAPVVK